jgi:hypothetical protein
MKVFGGSICGHKQQAREFAQTGQAKGSYPLYVCTLPRDGKGHETHYDNVHNVHF